MRYRAYDHRLRNEFARTGNPNLFSELGIPRTTVNEWIKKGVKQVVSHEYLELDKAELVQKLATVEAEVSAEKTKTELVVNSFRIFGLQIQYQRLPTAEAKTKLLELIKRASVVLTLGMCLEIIGLSAARYHSWVKRQVKCLLPDASSCPRLSPTKLIGKEISAIKDYVTAKDFGHFSIASLAWFAKREDKVFASLSAWYRVVREFDLRRPRSRIYPPKPKLGIRTTEPNIIWHVDQTIFKIVGGPKVFIQCVIDNFSRFILAWHVSTDYGGERTKTLLERALDTAKTYYPDILVPNVWFDSGSENINADVGSLITSGKIIQIIAQIDVEFSNSMIEAFFRILKHRWLFLHTLSDVDAVIAALLTFIHDYNSRIPHWAHKGGTPLEVYTGKWNSASLAQLAASTDAAREHRLIINKSVGCGLCPV